ncbi:hypothetical protein JCM11251_007604 [Rhodosporidiobolus azoricus]
MFRKLCPDYQDRCPSPDGDFARRQLLQWAELPFDMFDIADLKKKSNRSAMKGLLGRSAMPGFVTLFEALTEQLASLPKRLTRESLELHTEIVDIISQSSAVLDGARSVTRVASSDSNSSLTASSDAPHEPSLPPAAPPGGEQFAFEYLPDKGSKLDHLLPVETLCMLSEGKTNVRKEDVVINTRMHRTHILPNRPSNSHLLYALKMYYILVSGVVSRDYENNDVENLFYLSPTWHDQFRCNNLLIIPKNDFLQALLTHLNETDSPFDAHAFYNTLPSPLQPDQLAFQVIGLADHEVAEVLFVEGNSQCGFRLGPDWLFRKVGSEDELLPPRHFFRSTQGKGPSAAVNPVLFIIDATHKLIKQPVSSWPDMHEETFLTIITIYTRIFSCVKHNPSLYNTAIQTAGYRTARHKDRKLTAAQLS